MVLSKNNKMSKWHLRRLGVYHVLYCLSDFRSDWDVISLFREISWLLFAKLKENYEYAQKTIADIVYRAILYICFGNRTIIIPNL